MNKKYELNGMTCLLTIGKRIYPNIEVQQIVALRDIPEMGVKRGDTGGCLGQGDEIDHQDSSWVYFGETLFKGELIRSTRADIYEPMKA